VIGKVSLPYSTVKTSSILLGERTVTVKVDPETPFENRYLSASFDAMSTLSDVVKERSKSEASAISI
jgi:hypothetical protein